MGKKAAPKKKLPQAPIGGAGEGKKVKKNYLYEKTPRSFRIGGDVQPKRDLTRFTKWPQYIRLQRQKRILLQRLKVPPTLAQFQHTCDKASFTQLARLLKKIAPETRKEKNARLAEMAEAQKNGSATKNACPPTVKFGINHVTDLIESKKAKLVVLAHDVDPVEIICWMPALCRKMDVPYVVVKGKSRLGKFVHKKTASCLAITDVPKECAGDLKTLSENFHAMFNENKDATRHWGGGILGVKSQHVERYKQMLIEKEAAKKTGLLG